MKKLFAGFVGVAGLAAAAQGDIIPLPAGTPVIQAQSSWAAPLDSGSGGGVMDTGPAVYSSIPGPYSAFNPGVFSNFDDYTASPNANFRMDGFRFVGGISNSGGSLDFIFKDTTDTTTIAAFSVAFGTNTGDFIWTITFGVNGANDPLVNGAGVLHIQSTGGSAANAGRWFLTSTAPNPGSNSLAFGTTGSATNTLYEAFELQVPSPGSMALLGLGGVMAARRRRR